MKRVLFVCVHNSARSQMAEAFVRDLSRGAVEAESAGTRPAEAVDPIVVELMRERGIEMTSQRPKMLTPAMVQRADWVVDMGCMDAPECPAFLTGAEDWGIEDPHGKPMEEVRRVRDDVEKRVRAWLKQFGPLPARPGRPR